MDHEIDLTPDVDDLPDDADTYHDTTDVAEDARLDDGHDDSGAADGDPAATHAGAELTPTAEEIAAARATLTAAGIDVPDAAEPADDAPDADTMSTEDLRKLEEKMQDNSENAALLSNIATSRHQTAMGIIGNIR
jgi:hypothetical protein